MKKPHWESHPVSLSGVSGWAVAAVAAVAACCRALYLSVLFSPCRLCSSQVERKRHIGNDIVTIVFQEGEESSSAFKPSMIRSHFTRILGLHKCSSSAASPDLDDRRVRGGQPDALLGNFCLSTAVLLQTLPHLCSGGE